MPNWAWFLTGIGATHVFWAVVIAGWWGIVLRNSDPHERESFARDATEIRERIREALSRARNAVRN